MKIIIRSCILILISTQLSSCITTMYLSTTKDDGQCTKVLLDSIKKIYLAPDSSIIFNVYGNCKKINKKAWYYYSYKFIDKNTLLEKSNYSLEGQYHKIEIFNRPLIFIERGNYQTKKLEEKETKSVVRELHFIIDSIESIDSISSIILKHKKDIENCNDFAMVIKNRGNYEFYYLLYDEQRDYYLNYHLDYFHPIYWSKNKWKLPCFIVADIVLLPITIPVFIVLGIADLIIDH